MRPKLSAIDVTEKTLFERFYFVIGLVQICAMNRLFVCSHPPTVFTPAISRFLFKENHKWPLLSTSFCLPALLWWCVLMSTRGNRVF